MDEARPQPANASGHPTSARAWVVGSRLELSALPAEKLVAQGPSMLAIGPSSHLAAFRYGVVVFFGATDAEQAEWIARVEPCIEGHLPHPERDQLAIHVDPAAREGLDRNGRLVLNATDVERLQVVAHVLAKSTVLTHYEARVAEAFRHVEARSQEPEPAVSRSRSRELLREIREALAIQVQTVGRIETTEKPEILWDAPDLDRLYEHLSLEFELRERDAALTRKLDLISESASTSLEMIHARQGLRLEWYIVILIAVEIVLIVYDLARP